MKKFKALLPMLVVSAAVAFTGCSSDVDESANTVGDTTSADFVEYTSPSEGFTLSHPKSWISGDALGDIMNDPDMQDALIEEFGQDAFEVLMEMSAGAISASWLDPSRATANFMANINAVVTPADELTQEMLQERELKDAFEDMFDEVFSQVFEFYELVGRMDGGVFGDNYFVLAQANTAMFGVEQSFIQAITIVGPNFYTFTFTSPRGQSDMAMARAVISTFVSRHQ